MKIKVWGLISLKEGRSEIIADYHLGNTPEKMLEKQKQLKTQGYENFELFPVIIETDQCEKIK